MLCSPAPRCEADGALLVQEVIYAVTNTFEGRGFVNVNNSAVETTSDYLRELLPTWNETLIAAAAAVYEGLGSVDTQAVGIYGESTF